jgi:hypothetical protein
VVIGHDSVIAQLESSLPRVSIFYGPRSVGKHTAAEHLRDFYNVLPADYRYYPHLDMESARSISYASAVSPRGEFLLFVINMDGASRDAQDALLLPIEESSARFILMSSRHLPDTLLSRGTLYRFPLLSVESMTAILHKEIPHSTRIEDLAKASGGQVFRAFTPSRMAFQKSQVLQALRAFYSRESEPLESLTKDWSADHTDLLETWCQEAISGAWRIFEEDDTGPVDRKLAIRILIALRGGVRPRFVVRSKLMDIWKDYTA